MRELLLSILKNIVIAKKIQESGNLEHRLGELEESVAEEIADTYYTEDKLNDGEVFALGLELGRVAENDIVYRIPIKKKIYYFIGTEADIIRKIEAVKEKDTEELEKLEKLDEKDITI